MHRILTVPIDRIHSHPWQPRQYREQSYIERLAKSIMLSGLQQPIVAEVGGTDEIGEYYHIKDGHCRLDALKLLGHTHVEIVIDDGKPATLEEMLLPFLMREDLCAAERGEAMRRLSEANPTWSRKYLAERLKIDPAAVTVAFRTEEHAPPELRKLNIQRKLSDSHYHLFAEYVAKGVPPDKVLKEAEQAAAEDSNLTLAKARTRLNALLPANGNGKKKPRQALKTIREQLAASIVLNPKGTRLKSPEGVVVSIEFPDGNQEAMLNAKALIAMLVIEEGFTEVKK